MWPDISKHKNDTMDAPIYASADSAPQGYAINRSSLICPLFLLLFGIITLILFYLPKSEYYYAIVLSMLTGMELDVDVKMRFRLLFISFSLTFWLFSAGKLLKRLKLFLLMTSLCALAILLSDVMMLLISESGPFSLMGNIISGYAALLAIAVSITSQVKLPSGAIVYSKIKRPTFYQLRFFLAFIATASLAIFILRVAEREIDFLRNVALLGGLGPGLLLFGPLLMITLFLISYFEKKRKATIEQAPSVAFLVAALNEEEHIADCIRSLDEAAAKYSGITRLYMVDNGSKDNTCEIARREIEQCRSLKGVLLICPESGKSRALNLGLTHINEEILIRVDADTRIKSDILLKIIPYFSDPSVGGVGGIPLPKDPSHIIAKMRSLEVYYNIGFLRLGQRAVDAVTVIPGIMSAYRRNLVSELGGFTEGLNGEDTDITVRVGRMGYRIIVDPAIEVYSEVPKTLAHLREQRLRWSRSYIHVFARNKSAIGMLQGIRGLWVLPLGYIATFRRTLVVPILVYALIVALFNPTEIYLRQGASIVAVIIGSTFFLIIMVLLMYRRIDLIPYIPSYLALRLIRAYVSLEMLFTLPLKDSARK